MQAPRSILTVAEMGPPTGRLSPKGTPGLRLMERAGAGVADAVERRASPLAAPWCWQGQATTAATPMSWPGSSASAATTCGSRRWGRHAPTTPRPWPQPGAARRKPLKGVVGDAQLVVVGLFGAGLDRPLTGEALRLAWASERVRERVVAIDLPSGLSGDSGAARRRGCVSRRAHRHVPPPQARPRAAARPRPVRRGGGRRHRPRLDRDAAVREHARALALQVSLAAKRSPTSTVAAA